MSDLGLLMVSLIVTDMDDAISHFTNDWGFLIVRDTRHVSGHRWVEIAPEGGARLRLVEARDATERAVIGRQTGDRVAFFLGVNDLTEAIARWSANGLEMLEPPRHEDYGRVAVMKDAFGNRWDVFDRAGATQ